MPLGFYKVHVEIERWIVYWSKKGDNFVSSALVILLTFVFISPTRSLYV